MPDLSDIPAADRIALVPGKAAEYALAARDTSPGPREDTRVTIGGRDEKTGPRFVPQISVERWYEPDVLPDGQILGGDYYGWLSINHPDVVTNEEATFDGERVSLGVGDNTHEIYTKPDARLAHDVVLARRPPDDRIAFDIKCGAGVSLTLQKPLTIQEMIDGAERPDDVVWSIAVYVDRAHGRWKTGKLAHIYRPKFIDSNGDWVWGRWSFDGHQIVATVDPDHDKAGTWLDEAAYPVRLDPDVDVGYTSAGASTRSAFGPPRTIYFMLDTTQPEDGTLAAVHICPGSTRTGTTLDIGLVDASGCLEYASLSSQTLTGGTFFTASMSGAPLSNGTEYTPYWSVSASSSTVQWRYDNVGPSGYGYFQVNAASSCVSPAGNDYTGTGDRASAYYTYNPASSGTSAEYEASAGGSGGGTAQVATGDAYEAEGSGSGGGQAQAATGDAYEAEGSGSGGGTAQVATGDAYEAQAEGSGGGQAQAATGEAYDAQAEGSGGGTAEVAEDGGTSAEYEAAGGGSGGGTAQVATGEAITGTAGGQGGGTALVATGDAYTATGGGSGSGGATLIDDTPAPLAAAPLWEGAVVDIAHTFNNDAMAGDLVLRDGLLVMDSGLYTAVLHSLFSDRRAREDDPLVAGESRRGWWGDLVAAPEGDQYGSRLWLIRREKQTPKVLARAREYAEEALAWLLADGLATEVNVEATYPSRGVLGLAVAIRLVEGADQIFDLTYPLAEAA